MNKLKKDFSLLLKILEESVEKLSEQDLAGLIKGEVILVPKKVESKKEFEIGELKYQNIILQLADAKDRKQAESILLDSNILKKDLIVISDLLEVYVSKNDTKEKMIEKIIEATVGAKSRSVAIKGLDLKKTSKSNI